MYKCKMTAYEGNEPYIFISYAHKDSDMVLPILDVLAERGYRIWYDDGIAPGSEWPEYIAEHLGASSVVLAFVSNNSVASPNCRREINYALGKNKHFMAIMLEDAKMSPGMELQLSSHQCVFRYRFPSDEAFVKKVVLMKELEECKGEAAKLEEESHISGPNPIPPVNAEATGRVSYNKQESEVPASNSGKETETENSSDKSIKEEKTSPSNIVKEGESAKSKNEEKKKPGKAKKILMGIAAAIVGLVIVSSIAKSLNAVTVCGEKKSKNEKYLFLTNKTITSSDIKNISKMKKVTSISFSDCTFDAEIEDFSSLEKANSFSISYPVGLTDYTFVKSMKNLSTLKLEGCGIKGTLDLEGLTLTNLDVTNNLSLTKISNINTAKLSEIKLISTSVDDILFLKDADRLTRIYADNTNITDISPLAGLTSLSVISFSDCRLSDINDVFMSLSLKEIVLNNTGIKDLKAFDNMTVVSKLGISENNIEEAALIEKSRETLTEIYADYNPLNSQTLSDIAGCSNVTILSLNGIAMEDCSICSKMSNLKKIYASGCGIKSLAGLEKKNNLSGIFLSDNEISELGTLSSSMGEASGIDLDLSDNPLNDLSKLPLVSYNCIVMIGNDINIATIPSGLSGNALMLDYTEGMENMANLTGCSVRYFYIADVPLDKQLGFKDSFGSKLYMGDEETMRTAVSSYGYDQSKWSIFFN